MPDWGSGAAWESSRGATKSSESGKRGSQEQAGQCLPKLPSQRTVPPHRTRQSVVLPHPWVWHSDSPGSAARTQSGPISALREILQEGSPEQGPIQDQRQQRPLGVPAWSCGSTGVTSGGSAAVVEPVWPFSAAWLLGCSVPFPPAQDPSTLSLR